MKRIARKLSFRIGAYGMFLSVLVLCGFSSCMTLKDITYFQPTTPSVDKVVKRVEQAYTPRIKPGDILSIRVASLNQEANAMFNPMQEADYYNNAMVGTIAPRPIEGFTVDSEGFVTIPLVGQVKAAGYNSKELSVKLTSDIAKYLESPTVTVRIANYQISVLGEVARPAVYTISNEVITLPEALALAGDVTSYGKKKNVLIIRETNGQREFARIDLTGREFFDTPYYYLHSGDVIYVEPTPGKTTSSDRTIQLMPIAISSLTLLVLIFNAFK